jgi:hypothetical protein
LEHQHIDKQGAIAGTKRDEIPSEVGGAVKDSRKNCSLKAEDLALQRRSDNIVESKESSRVGRNVMEHNVPGVFGSWRSLLNWRMGLVVLSV